MQNRFSNLLFFWWIYFWLKKGLPPFMGGSPEATSTGSFAFAGGGESFGDLLDRHIGSPPFNTPRA